MATQLVCDGCRTPLFTHGVSGPLNAKELIVQGDRVDGLMDRAPLPQGLFHWCKDCAVVAFNAVYKVNRL